MSTPTATDQFVLDGSVTLAWLFHDEQDAYADAIVARLPDIEMHVPRLWHLEVANVLLVGESGAVVRRPTRRLGSASSPGCPSWSTQRRRHRRGRSRSTWPDSMA